MNGRSRRPPAAQAPRQGRGGNAGDSAAPARKEGDGVGPFKKMVIRSVTLIDGTGGPPLSPMDIVIEGNRITSVRQAGWPGLPQQANREPRDADYEIDGKGMYVMPGFVDVHVHGAGKDKAPDLSYSYKLWLAHGVTTVRGVSLSSAALSSSEKNRSAKNEIVAPRIFNYQTLGSGWSEGPVRSPEKAREWVRWAAANNIDGIKFFNRGDETPEIDTAAIDEAHKNKMGTVAHLSQNNVAMFNARQAGDAHLDTVTHYYGHFESLLKDKTIQEFPVGYDYNNEQDRFGDIARIWNQTYEPGSQGVGRVPRAPEGEPRHLRSDVQHLRRVARPDAGAQRRLAPDLHDAAAVELLPEHARQPRLVLLRLDHRERSRVEELLPALHAADQRLQEHGRPHHRRHRLGLHLQDLRLRLHRGARADARGRLPAARDHPLGDDVRRAGRSTSRRGRRRRSAWCVPACWPIW